MRHEDVMYHKTCPITSQKIQKLVRSSEDGHEFDRQNVPLRKPSSEFEERDTLAALLAMGEAWKYAFDARCSCRLKISKKDDDLTLRTQDAGGHTQHSC